LGNLFKATLIPQRAKRTKNRNIKPLKLPEQNKVPRRARSRKVPAKGRIGIEKMNRKYETADKLHQKIKTRKVSNPG